MSCKECDDHQMVTYIRWGNANVGMAGCNRHLSEVIEALRWYQKMRRDAYGEETPDIGTLPESMLPEEKEGV